MRSIQFALRTLAAAGGIIVLALGFASPAGAANAGAKMTFPLGVATPSEECGGCHQALYREFAAGEGADLQWKPMRLQPTSVKVLGPASTAPTTATAHAVAGTDPWPIEAARVEANGKPCNVCHYPEAFDYPDLSKAALDKPVPRQAGREHGITCASCHMTKDGKIRGPYQVDAPHEVVLDPRIQTSAACALCHAAGERVVGKQTQTSLEWLEDFNKAGRGTQQCQDCHMPKTMRKLAEDYPVPERAVARHTWPGGHSFKQIKGALELSVAQPQPGRPEFALRVANVGAGHSVPTGSNRRAIYLTAEARNASGKVVASKEWMFAPWMLGRPDDKKFVAEDLKGPDPVATSQADAQGPHETIIRAGETRVLAWQPDLPAGSYTVQATLVYDLNRYNDRAFKDDQTEIGRAGLAAKIASSKR